LKFNGEELITEEKTIIITLNLLGIRAIKNKLTTIQKFANYVKIEYNIMKDEKQ